MANTLTEIRTAVLGGDIDGAMELTDGHYPEVLRTNEHIHFRLRCRKFVEMVRTRMGENDEQRRRRRRLDKGKAPMDMSDSRMDLDDDPDAPPDVSGSDGVAGDMDTAEDEIGEPDDNDDGDMQRDDEEEEDEDEDEEDVEEEAGGAGAGLSDLDLIEYGRELSAQFSANPRKDIRQELETMNGLMAYPNPKDGPLKELLEERGRIPIAEQLNSAILGKLVRVWWYLVLTVIL
jgi:Ran-binding protein 9/10